MRPSDRLCCYQNNNKIFTCKRDVFVVIGCCCRRRKLLVVAALNTTLAASVKFYTCPGAVFKCRRSVALSSCPGEAEVALADISSEGRGKIISNIWRLGRQIEH